MQRAGTLTDPAVPCSGVERDAVLLPTTVDESLHLGAHLDLRRPPPSAFLGPFVGGVDAHLPAVKLACRGVVEVVERTFGDQDVALRIDVGADPEEHLL